MRYSFTAHKNLWDYPFKGKQQTIYEENKENCGGNITLAQSISQAERNYNYWKIQGGKSVTTHPEKYQLDIAKLKVELWTSIEPILTGYGITEGDLEKLKSELIPAKLKRAAKRKSGGG
jgi:hypothetical protein